MKIKIDPEFRDLIPPLSEEEKISLENNLAENGFNPAYPLIIWKGHDILVDGHNRYDACVKLGVEPCIIEQEFESREAVIDWMVDNQLSRRNIDANTRAYLIGKKYNLEKKSHRGEGCNNCNPKTNETIAAEYNVSPRSVNNAANYYNAVEKICAGGEISRYDLMQKTSMKSVTEMAKLADLEQKAAVEKLKAGESLSSTNAGGIYAISLKLDEETGKRLKKLTMGKSSQDYIRDLINTTWESANNSITI